LGFAFGFTADAVFFFAFPFAGRLAAALAFFALRPVDALFSGFPKIRFQLSL